MAAICRFSSSVLVMMSPFTLTSTCSMTCARRGRAKGSTSSRHAPRRAMFLIRLSRDFYKAKCLKRNILPHQPAGAQLAQQARHAGEHAAFGTGIFFGRPQDFVPGEPAGHLAGRGPRGPPGAGRDRIRLSFDLSLERRTL